MGREKLFFEYFVIYFSLKFILFYLFIRKILERYLGVTEAGSIIYFLFQLNIVMNKRCFFTVMQFEILVNFW